jgi:hypothetical protein
MEKITSLNHKVWFELDRLGYHAVESRINVLLPGINSAGRIYFRRLGKGQMRIGKMDQSLGIHAPRPSAL